MFSININLRNPIAPSSNFYIMSINLTPYRWRCNPISSRSSFAFYLVIYISYWVIPRHFVISSYFHYFLIITLVYKPFVFKFRFILDAEQALFEVLDAHSSLPDILSQLQLLIAMPGYKVPIPLLAFQSLQSPIISLG